MFKYIVIVNEDFKKFDIWGNLDISTLNSSVITDDFINDNNLRKLEKVGAMKIIPIGKIETSNNKKVSSSNLIRKSRKQLLEVTHQDETSQTNSELLNLEI